jgi:hypothetical protein
MWEQPPCHGQQQQFLCPIRAALGLFKTPILQDPLIAPHFPSMLPITLPITFQLLFPPFFLLCV